MLTMRSMRHFSLRRNPFQGEIRETGDIFLSEDHIFIKEMMSEAARHRGFVAAFGEVGCGKSTMRKAVVRELMDAGIQTIYPVILDKSRITGSSLLDAVIMDISDETPRRSLEQKTRQAVRLLQNRHANGLRQCLVIEEAHLLNVHALKALKQMYEIEDGYQKLVGIVLIGQPELRGKLDESRYPQLREVIRRITLAEIEGLQDRDVTRYITHKIEKVNARPDAVFAEDSFAALARRLMVNNGQDRPVSKAFPLSINNLCAQAMNRAAEFGETLVSAELVNAL